MTPPARPHPTRRGAPRGTSGATPREKSRVGSSPGRNARRALQRLARLHGVQGGYRSTDGRRRTAGDEVLVAVLGALGAPLRTLDEAPEALQAALEERRRQVLGPVVAHRAGGSVGTTLTLPASVDPDQVWVSLHREDGEVDRRRLGGTGSRVAADEGGAALLRHTFRLRRTGVPVGYHRLVVEGPGVDASALVVSAPARLAPGPRQWGLNAPLYALRTRGDWGTGSFTDLGTLATWAGEHGAGLTGTLPLFASYLDAPGADPSPYLPVSRLAWNELYVDVETLAELESCPEARAELSSPALREQLFRLRRSPLAHPTATLAVKRRILEPLAAALVAQDPRRSARRAAFDAFVAAHPEILAYARFRAARERLGGQWREWPADEDAALRRPAPDGRARRIADDPVLAYHLYVQWVADTQLAAVAAGGAGGTGAGLYLDLPVGVHAGGFDPWWEPGAFVRGVSGGAPPDDFFPGGQSWGFPPLHPEGIRAQGYRYLVGALRTAMRHASALRLDHVMGLHRMYWVPDGADASDGVYVTYHGDELHALLVLEAARAGVVVVGEDLGTVPTNVERAMARDRLLSSYVFQFESTLEDPLPPVSRRALASFGTHDLPTFAGYWRGLDIGDRRRRDLIDADEAAAERRRRSRWRSALLSSLPTGGLAALPTDGAAAEERRALEGVLHHLAAGQAEVVMVDLEDLWLEHEPQNRPGSGPEEANFRRRAGRSLEDVVADAGITALLREVDARRRPELETPVGLPADQSSEPPDRRAGGPEPETSDWRGQCAGPRHQRRPRPCSGPRTSTSSTRAPTAVSPPGWAPTCSRAPSPRWPSPSGRPTPGRCR